MVIGGNWVYGNTSLFPTKAAIAIVILLLITARRAVMIGKSVLTRKCSALRRGRKMMPIIKRNMIADSQAMHP